jgi:pimeloyl-ACP methyl ester carboxylesterase
LLQALGLAPAAVFATSGGAIIGLNLVICHPEVVRGAILHEPPLMSVVAHPEETMGMIQGLVGRGMAAGGPRGGAEAFIRFAAGDANFEALDPALRERMLGNGEVLFGAEFGQLEPYRPSDAELAAVRVPVQVMTGRATIPFLRETSEWLAARLHVPVVPAPGAHAPYFDRPGELVDAIRPALRRMS